MATFTEEFLQEIIEATNQISKDKIEAIADGLARVRENKGRLFFLGVGGSAGNCGHAVNDFRKICGFETYAPTDNVSELTARANDEGFDTIFSEWLKVSNFRKEDGIFIFSVGGGNVEKNVSVGLVRAIDLAKEVGASIFGVVSKDGGYTAKSSDTVVVVPVVNDQHITPIAEAYQGVVWHLLVTHPKLKMHQTKWESTK